MIKYVVLLRRRTDITRETFCKHWLANHLSLVKQLPGLRAYVFSPSMDVEDYAASYDGVGELWFDDIESAMAAFQSETGQRVRADTATFADSEHALRLFTADAASFGMNRVAAESPPPDPIG